MNPKNHKEKLLTAAVDLMYRRGYHATSIGDIARAARVPKGSIYNHFEGKEDLAAQVVDRLGEKSVRDLGERIAGSRAAPSTLVERLLDHYIEAYGKTGYRYGCTLGSRLNEVADTEPKLADRIAGHLGAWAAILQERFEAWGRAHDRPNLVRSAPRLARTVQATFQGAILQMKGARSPEPLEGARDTLRTLLQTFEGRMPAHAARRRPKR